MLANQSKAFRRNPRRPGVGGRVVFQKITTTLGTVGSNGSEQIECEMTCLLNPATMKEATGSNAFGPLGIYASTYALFKMTKCELHLKPLVGDSAVSGTVVRASWNPTATPSQTSWSSLGARKHIDITPGKKGRFILTSRDLKGPKDGWYKTNTQGDPMMAFAGALEIHTIGKTMSTYQGKPFEGGLFLAELTTEWQFKDYQQQPGMLNLVKGEDKTDARITTDDNGKMQLVLPARTSRMARAATSSASKTIWVVTDTIINTGASIFPPPFSWLIRGGWWIVKRAANAPIRSNEITFDIYSSISDARSESPCISTQAGASIPIGGLHFQQITPGNVGIGDELVTTRSIDAPIPPDQTAPNRVYITSSTMFKLGTQTEIPSVCMWYNNNGGQNHNNKGVGFVCDGTKVNSFTIYKVSVHTDVGPASLAMFEHKIPFKLYGNNITQHLGQAVASTYVKANESPNLWMSLVLVYAEYARSETFSARWDTTKATYPVGDYQVEIRTQKAGGNSNLYINMQQGGWYIVQYAVYGQSEGSYLVGRDIIATRGTGEVSTTVHTFPPHTSHFSSGLFPAYMTGLILKPFTTSTVTYSTELRAGDAAQNSDQITYSDLDPSFGCDDSMELPPPPSVEDLADDEDEEEEPETSNFYDFDSDLDEDRYLEMGPDDHYSDPPMSRLVVRDDAFALYEQLRATHSERAARLAVNQLFPSDEYTEFTEVYHDALADGLSPKEARAQALGF